jgi:transcriptional regulator with XRE-family HTH domain
MDPIQAIYPRAGRVIKRKRKEKLFKQEALARAAGLTRTSISNIELGRQKILLDTFMRIAMALGTTPTELMKEILLEDIGSPVIKNSDDPVERYLLNEIINTPGGGDGNKS